jgi:hypothetical protein
VVGRSVGALVGARLGAGVGAGVGAQAHEQDAQVLEVLHAPSEQVPTFSINQSHRNMEARKSNKSIQETKEIERYKTKLQKV